MENVISSVRSRSLCGMPVPGAVLLTGLLAGLLGLCAACSSRPAEASLPLSEQPAPAEASAAMPRDRTAQVPPPRIRAWMDRLTVDHAYDPATGFIVAREVIALPPIIAAGPPAAEAVQIGKAQSRRVVVFATADRCAPCQQYKKSALNHPDVIEALSRQGLLATHIEVDRQPEVAETLLGSRAIPMTYLFVDGERVAELRGQRSAAELLAWLEASAES